MPKYRVSIYYSASIDYEVEAEDEDSALDLALAIEEPKDVWSEKVWENIEFADAFVREKVP
jgi:hypothetical protein